MPRNDPKSQEGADNERGLEAKQVVALESLLRGATATEAARVAGVDRRTIFRWLRTDFQFQAAVNRGRRELREAAMMRLERLTDSAVTALERALGQGDSRLALVVLRGLGFLNGVAGIGSEDPDALAQEARSRSEALALEARSQASLLRIRESLLDFEP